MRCEEVKNLLSPYLEEDLDPQAKGLVEEHLKDCKLCSQELLKLKNMLSDLKTLPEVEPPADFLESVYARLARPSWLQRVFQRLFVPFHIKLPLEAMAVTVSVILVVIFVHKTALIKTNLISSQIEGEQQFQFEQVHPQGMAKQMAEADSQGMAQQRERPAAKSLEGLPKEALVNKASVPAHDLAVPLAREPKEGSFAKGSFKIAESPARSAESSAVKPRVEKEIVFKTQSLEQDKAKVKAILSDLKIADTKIEESANQVSFHFTIVTSLWEEFLSKFKNWPAITIPSEEISAQKKPLQPISVKLTLTTQDHP